MSGTHLLMEPPRGLVRTWPHERLFSDIETVVAVGGRNFKVHFATGERTFRAQLYV